MKWNLNLFNLLWCPRGNAIRIVATGLTVDVRSPLDVVYIYHFWKHQIEADKCVGGCHWTGMGYDEGSSFFLLYLTSGKTQSSSYWPLDDQWFESVIWILIIGLQLTSTQTQVVDDSLVFACYRLQSIAHADERRSGWMTVSGWLFMIVLLNISISKGR